MGLREALREWWASASSQEKDAKVAEALGVSCDSSWAIREPDGSIRWESDLPPYSTSWEHAGDLLDRLRAEGWDYQLSASTLGVPPCITIARLTDNGPLRIDARDDDERGAIALAFCLSRLPADLPGSLATGGIAAERETFRLWLREEGDAEVEVDVSYGTLKEAAKDALLYMDTGSRPVRITGPGFDWRPRPDTVREELEEIGRKRAVQGR